MIQSESQIHRAGCTASGIWVRLSLSLLLGLGPGPGRQARALRESNSIYRPLSLSESDWRPATLTVTHWQAGCRPGRSR
jgi:hypothetical protein